jgi:beta-lactamase class A
VPACDHNIHVPEGTPRTLGAVGRMTAVGFVVLLGAALAPAATGAPRLQATGGVVGVYPALKDPGRLAYPSAAAVDAARRYVKRRRGRVSFAVADLRGGIAGAHVNRTYRAASLSKAMLLVAYLDKLARERRKADGKESFWLDAMIRVSDNESAISLYKRLGPGPMRALARRAGMLSFSVGGSWSEARVTAADQARFFLRLNRLLAPSQRVFARYVLSVVQPQQSWGIPAAARPKSWQVFFKGGWRTKGQGEVVHQAALLERGHRHIAIAVLSDQDPSEPYGHETVKGVARRLLSRARPAPYPRYGAQPGQLAPIQALDGYRAPPTPPLRPLSSQLASRLSGK